MGSPSKTNCFAVRRSKWNADPSHWLKIVSGMEPSTLQHSMESRDDDSSFEIYSEFLKEMQQNGKRNFGIKKKEFRQIISTLSQICWSSLANEKSDVDINMLMEPSLLVVSKSIHAVDGKNISYKIDKYPTILIQGLVDFPHLCQNLLNSSSESSSEKFNEDGFIKEIKSIKGFFEFLVVSHFITHSRELSCTVLPKNDVIRGFLEGFLTRMIRGKPLWLRHHHYPSNVSVLLAVAFAIGNQLEIGTIPLWDHTKEFKFPSSSNGDIFCKTHLLFEGDEKSAFIKAASRILEFLGYNVLLLSSSTLDPPTKCPCVQDLLGACGKETPPEIILLDQVESFTNTNPIYGPTLRGYYRVVKILTSSSNGRHIVIATTALGNSRKNKRSIRVFGRKPSFFSAHSCASELVELVKEERMDGVSSWIGGKHIQHSAYGESCWKMGTFEVYLPFDTTIKNTNIKFILAEFSQKASDLIFVLPAGSSNISSLDVAAKFTVEKQQFFRKRNPGKSYEISNGHDYNGEFGLMKISVSSWSRCWRGTTRAALMRGQLEKEMACRLMKIWSATSLHSI